MSEYDFDLYADQAQQFDTSGDGVTDMIVAPSSDGTTTAYTDRDQNGVFEGAVVYRADGSPSVVFQDTNQVGRYDVAAVDQNGNGVFDTYVVDTNGDGQLDTTEVDLNENGVNDAQESAPAVTVPSGPGIIGPVTNPDPLYSLQLRLTEETGHVVFPPDDRDHDGYPDNQDNHPGDPYRR